MRTVTRLAVIALALGLASCATIEGIGEDVASGARAVRNAF